MQQATASATASAFRNKAVDLGSLPWSGRLEPADLARPAGMLIAALTRCAHERGLSLSEMATAMDVSYWDVSQLRIGIRRLDVLDDSMAEACAAFLERPLLTINMLAGLLDPHDALMSAALTPEDIVHARQLLACEPAELLLSPPANRARPLQGLGVEDLAELHQAYGANPAVCDAVRAELGFRPMSKTEVLRAAVNRGAEAAQPAPRAESRAEGRAPGIMRCASCQKRLRIPLLSEPGDIRCPACQTEYHVDWQATVCVVQRHDRPADDPAPEDGTTENGHEHGHQPVHEHVELEPGEAWKVLGLKPGSEWAAVERARRSLLQQYHPDRLGHVSPLVLKLAENAFKRVGDAYEALKVQR